MADLMTLEDVRDWHRFSQEAAKIDGHTNWASTHKELADAIDAAIKQRERDKGDAARYRWLAQVCGDADVFMETRNKLELDARIDAAMAKESGNG